MTSSPISIVDYGMGNLRSVQKAFERLNVEARIVRTPDEIAAAQKLVLPGVGAFRDAIDELNHQQLAQPIRDHISRGRPFLGICLGLQLLFDVSYEDGEYQGLGIIPGSVQRFVLPPEFKIPHMGWNQIVCRQPGHPMLSGLSDSPWFYFVHSYHVVPTDSAWIAATADYGGPFVAAIARDNVFASQFHPEKSQDRGRHLLGNFVALPVQ